MAEGYLLGMYVLDEYLNDGSWENFCNKKNGSENGEILAPPFLSGLCLSYNTVYRFLDTSDSVAHDAIRERISQYHYNLQRLVLPLHAGVAECCRLVAQVLGELNLTDSVDEWLIFDVASAICFECVLLVNKEYSEEEIELLSILSQKLDDFSFESMSDG